MFPDPPMKNLAIPLKKSADAHAKCFFFTTGIQKIRKNHYLDGKGNSLLD